MLMMATLVPSDGLLISFGVLLLVLGIMLTVDYRRKREFQPFDYTTIVVLLFFSFIYTDVVWYPAELVTQDSSSFVGYVLEDDGNWMTVINETDRSVAYLETASVTDRKPCSLEAESSPLLRGGKERIDLPLCDDALSEAQQRHSADL